MEVANYCLVPSASDAAHLCQGSFCFENLGVGQEHFFVALKRILLGGVLFLRVLLLVSEKYGMRWKSPGVCWFLLLPFSLSRDGWIDGRTDGRTQYIGCKPLQFLLFKPP